MFDKIVCYRRVIGILPSKYDYLSHGTNLGSIQLAISLSEKAKRELNLLPLESISSYSITWINNPKKYSREILSDEIIIDTVDTFINKKTHYRSSTFGMYLRGRFGFDVDPFVDNDGIDTDNFNKELLDRNHSYLSSIPKFYQKSGYSISMSEMVPNLTPQGKLFILMYINYHRLWEGRDEKFRVLQYTTEQIEKESLDVVNLQQTQFDRLAKELGVNIDTAVCNAIREMISKPFRE